jgi:hypothetical protein
MTELAQTEITRRKPVPGYAGHAVILDLDGVQTIVVAPEPAALNKIAQVLVPGTELDPAKFHTVAVIQN